MKNYTDLIAVIAHLVLVYYITIATSLISDMDNLPLNVKTL